MKAPSFWWRAEPTVAAWIATPIAQAVDGVARNRMARSPRLNLGIPVICVGNPTVGGAGKTPVALAIAERLISAGRRPVFLTRGYGGRAVGPLVVRDHSAAEVGDEARLLVKTAPTVVARRRDLGGALAARHGDVVVMDDGFQNPQLVKDLSLLLVDRAAGLGNGKVTPAGPLRADFAAQARQADILVLTDAGEGIAMPLPAVATPVVTVPLTPFSPVSLKGTRTFVFAGVARPQKVFAAVAALGADVVGTRAFGDHQPLTDKAARQLMAEARRLCAVLVTTQKDAVRLDPARPSHASLLAAIRTVGVRAELPDALVSEITTVCNRVRRDQLEPETFCAATKA